MQGEEEHSVLEGMFDAQMSLPLAGAVAPEPFTSVIKRDGREESFDTSKIAHAIARASAVAAPNEAEHAWDLAKAVRVHLWKELGDRPPHVDQIHEAVERVLVAMSRQRTALAYARYRVRRARQRASGEGVRVALGVLEEDAYVREAMGGRSDALFVRTSADTLAAWDRAKIVGALVRETGLRENTAEAIALEVEQQIAAARIDALTASLVRELVDAKLAEHGLAEFRERHRRLGVPLYDTALMLRGMAPFAAGNSPADTERALARVLKKEYALAEVFSPAVAQAHLRGDFHIKGLGEIDRFGSARLPLSTAVDFEESESPDAALQFLARWRQSARLIDGYLKAPCAWTNIGAVLASAVRGLDTAAQRQFALMILFEFSELGDASPVTLRLDWPGGAPGCAPFFRAMLDTLMLARERGTSFTRITLEVAVSPGLFGAFPPNEDLDRLARAVALGVGLRFVFQRGPVAVQHPVAWLQTLALNLPRAARHENEIGGSPQWLRDTLRTAAVAHEEKRLFMEELWARGADGPLAALRASCGGNTFAPAACATHIAVDGLLDAVRLQAGGDAGFFERAERLLITLRSVCAEVVAETGANLVLCANSSREASTRFASLEPREEEDSPADGPRAFACGLSLPPRLTAVDAAQLHGRLSALLDVAPPLIVSLGPEDYAATSIAALLQRVLTTTDCGALEFRAL